MSDIGGAIMTFAALHSEKNQLLVAEQLVLNNTIACGVMTHAQKKAQLITSCNNLIAIEEELLEASEKFYQRITSEPLTVEFNAEQKQRALTVAISKRNEHKRNIKQFKKIKKTWSK